MYYVFYYTYFVGHWSRNVYFAPKCLAAQFKSVNIYTVFIFVPKYVGKMFIFATIVLLTNQQCPMPFHLNH